MISVRFGMIVLFYPAGLKGIFIALFLMWVFDKLIQKAYAISPINFVDKNVWYDSENNRCFIMAAAILDKTDECNLKQIFKDRLVKMDTRFRSKMVKVLDNYYFKEMKGTELQEKLEKAYVTLPKMDSIADAEDLMSEN